MREYIKPEICVQTLTSSEKLMTDCSDGNWVGTSKGWAEAEGEISTFVVCEGKYDGMKSAAV